MTTSTIALAITLALNASQEEIDAAHDAIDSFFGEGLDTGVAPAAVVAAQSGQPAPTPATPSNGVELDNDGLPWDERIHSSNKKKSANGKWQLRRNVQPAQRTKIEGELRATLAAGGGAAQPAATPAAAAPTNMPVPGAAAPSGMPMPGAAAPAVDPNFTELTQTISAMLAAGKVDEAGVKSWLLHFGIADGNLQNAVHNPEATKNALAEFKKYA